MNNNVKDVLTVVDMGVVGLCAIDTMVRMEDKKMNKDINIYSCENCLFREELDAVVCPYRMMITRGRRVLL